MENQLFDEKAQTALRLLMENFWILREKDPDMYQLVREREKVLQRYVEEKLGFSFIVHQHFIKLEKIPIEPKSWMGIAEFQDSRDYAMFCCALAFTETRTIEEQFLLSDICEDIKDLYPGDIGLDWTNYNHRRSLIRVIKGMEKLAIIKVVEGEVEQFATNEQLEVLYETTIYARYFMRSYPKDLEEYDTISDILTAEWGRHEDDARRKSVYRKLMMTPVVYRETEDDADFAYIRNYRNRLREDIESHTTLRLEVFKNAALLVSEERKQELTLLPDQKAITDVALHFANYIRQRPEQFKTNEYDEIRISPIMFEQTVTEMHVEYGEGWSKHYREGTITNTMQELTSFLYEWDMLRVEPDTGAFLVRPLIGRVSGYYPKDFSLAKDEQNDEN